MSCDGHRLRCLQPNCVSAKTLEGDLSSSDTPQVDGRLLTIDPIQCLRKCNHLSLYNNVLSERWLVSCVSAWLDSYAKGIADYARNNVVVSVLHQSAEYRNALVDSCTIKRRVSPALTVDLDVRIPNLIEPYVYLGSLAIVLRLDPHFVGAT